MKWEPPLNIELAPRERLLFVERLGDLFITEILGCEGALITDESLIWDFSDIFSYDIDHALRPGKTPGLYVFKKKKIVRGHQAASHFRDIHERLIGLPDEEIETEPTFFRRDICLKTIEIFGVDITPVFDRYLPEVLQYILARMPENKRSDYRTIFS